MNTSRARRTAVRVRTAWGDVWNDLRDDETGDVPGWVLITLMSAGLVVLIWALAGPALTGLFERAISSVNGI
ncbi:hypothetical protein N8K70_09880 [Microbacterium betulae]|uniref:Uncharacterized protein n=1 Tax=Microbacterium betulae TaxID=2981139 RepID=A0AA97FEU0_9MICO|nr:hypothetical protein [Microbacterium sp. AB]WOF21700.1 hypothetical protein N8K70_09880 [Microbacterium sp. AB]